MQQTIRTIRFDLLPSNMAFLICYSESATEDNCRQQAIYLDQKFYKLIFRNCLNQRSDFAILSVVAALRYKSPLLVIASGELDALLAELVYLEEMGLRHPQFAELRDVCAKAKAESYHLSVSGDMFPEL